MPEFSRDLSRRVSRFMQLPRRSNDTWQGGVVPLPLFVRDPNTSEAIRQWLIAWANLATDDLSATSASEEEARDRDRVLEMFIDLGLKHRKAREGRPARLEVQDESLGEFIRDALGDRELEIVVLPALQRIAQEVDDIIRDEHAGPPPPGALDAPDVTVDRMRAFADAARHLYVRAPWYDVGHDDLIVIEEPPPPDGMACFVVTDDDRRPALEFYSSREQFEDEGAEEDEDPESDDPEGDDTLDEDFEDDEFEEDDDEVADAGLAWRVDYVRIDQLPVFDVELWADDGLPVAGPAAHPVLIKPIGFREYERADGSRLAFVEGLLRALALTTEDEIDSGRWTHAVETADGPITYELSMPSLLDETGEDREYREKEEVTFAKLARFFAEGSFDDMDAAVAEIERLGLSALDYPAPVTSLERAQDLVYRSGGATARRRTQMLRAALALSPDCVDACVHLGEIARDPARALANFEAGLAAGDRALPAELLIKQRGRYWTHYQTRALLRARLGLATTLKRLGRMEEAAREFETLLELDESDQGEAGPHLLALLLEEGRDEDAAGLVSERQYVSSAWAYGLALWAFRNLARQDAREALDAAIAINPHVARLLATAVPDDGDHRELDDIALDEPGPDDSTHEQFDDAFDCATLLARAWRSTPGAIRWLGEEWARRRQARKRRGRRWG